MVGVSSGQCLRKQNNVIRKTRVRSHEFFLSPLVGLCSQSCRFAAAAESPVINHASLRQSRLWSLDPWRWKERQRRPLGNRLRWRYVGSFLVKYDPAVLSSGCTKRTFSARGSGPVQPDGVRPAASGACNRDHKNRGCQTKPTEVLASPGLSARTLIVEADFVPPHRSEGSRERSSPRVQPTARYISPPGPRKFCRPWHFGVVTVVVVLLILLPSTLTASQHLPNWVIITLHVTDTNGC
jgi:hypothetical protein